MMFVLGILLGTICVTPCVLLYLLLLKGMDRYEPEPWGLLALTFFWGAAVATLTSIVGQNLFEAWAGFADGNPLHEAISATLLAPFTEETSKMLGLLLLWGVSALALHELDGPLDGVIYGGVVGLGFTLTEDILYVAGAMAEGGPEQFAALFVVRTVLAGLGHASFTALAGLGIGVAAATRNPLLKLAAPLAGWMAAMALHALHNGLLVAWPEDGVGLVVKLLLFWLIDLFWLVLVLALVLRDRGIVQRELGRLGGDLLQPFELQRTASHRMLLPLWNWFSLKDSPGGYRAARRRQLDLVELAFLRCRAGRGETGLAAREEQLRRQLESSRAAGITVGPPPRPRPTPVRS